MLRSRGRSFECESSTTRGFDQVRLDTGADLMALDELDQKLWVALVCRPS